jgi:SAM-dependent methyltransferase
MTLIRARESTAVIARDAWYRSASRTPRPIDRSALAGVAPPHHRLVRRLYTLLAAGEFETPDAQRRADARLLGSGEMELLDRCGPALADVLRGHVDPIALLFPNGSFDVLDRLYRDSPFARTYNGALRETLRAEVNARGGVPLRILEIGAGTGGTTSYVLDVLPPGSRYVFTDLSPLFLERARQRFGSHSELEYRLLNVEMDPASQGFSPGSFDVVIASNVLHATADVRDSLEHWQLAAPGALLLMLEGTAPLHWWMSPSASPTAGGASPITAAAGIPIDASRWVSLLHEIGFADAMARVEVGRRRSQRRSRCSSLARRCRRSGTNAAAAAGAGGR